MLSDWFNIQQNGVLARNSAIRLCNIALENLWCEPGLPMAGSNLSSTIFGVPRLLNHVNLYPLEGYQTNCSPPPFHENHGEAIEGAPLSSLLSLLVRRSLKSPITTKDYHLTKQVDKENYELCVFAPYPTSHNSQLNTNHHYHHKCVNQYDSLNNSK